MGSRYAQPQTLKYGEELTSSQASQNLEKATDENSHHKSISNGVLSCVWFSPYEGQQTLPGEKPVHQSFETFPVSCKLVHQPLRSARA